MIEAASFGDALAVAELMGRGASAKGVDAEGFTALMWAARYELPEAAAVLIPESDLDQREPGGRRAVELARPGGAVAGLIAAWLLARAEVEQLGWCVGSAKTASRRFTL